MATASLSPGFVTGSNESSTSAVSWAAVIAGAFVASALLLLLLALGTGLGLTVASPWSSDAGTAKAIGIGSAIWLIISQAISAAMGGYLAGRLRTKWVDIHTTEVFFRDTAHGFLVWAVGAVISASLLSSAVTSLVSGAADTMKGVVSTAAQSATQSAPAIRQANPADAGSYFADTLLRSDKPAPTSNNDPAIHAELSRIVAASVRNGSISPADRDYVAKVIAARTGASEADAQRRIDRVIQQAQEAAERAAVAARQAADTARKAGAYFAFWTCLSMLVGAFSASLAATFGGRTRDRAPSIDVP
jgi:hypothetical protein